MTADMTEDMIDAENIKTRMLYAGETQVPPKFELALYTRPTICGTFAARIKYGAARHSWLYLDPSDAQVEELVRLLTFGRGRMGSVSSDQSHDQNGLALIYNGKIMVGVRREDAYDRICTACLLAENRMEPFIDALRRARGEL